MNKKVLIIVIIVMVIGIICGIVFSKNSNKSITTNAKVNEIEENVIVNEETDNVVNQIEENIIEEDNNIVENTQTITSSSETFVESPKSDGEKAIEIVKKDWGDTSGVTFNNIATQPDGRQVITVNDVSTTKVLVYYYVNVSDGTFTKEY